MFLQCIFLLWIERNVSPGTCAAGEACTASGATSPMPLNTVKTKQNKTKQSNVEEPQSRPPTRSRWTSQGDACVPDCLPSHQNTSTSFPYYPRHPTCGVKFHCKGIHEHSTVGLLSEPSTTSQRDKSLILPSHLFQTSPPSVSRNICIRQI